MFGVPFLQSVAADIVRKYGDDLSKLTVVFPNNRAQLFFNDCLLNAASDMGLKQPIWSPSYTTIKKMFEQHSSLQIADPIKLVCLLYDTYMEVLNHGDEYGLNTSELKVDETLDSFYHWGEILLSDFEDIDNNMVNAQMLFQNIKDGVPFEADSTFLTDEQREVLKHFFAVFKEGDETVLKRRFLQLWSLLHPIYVKYRQRLLSEKLAYEGMLKRQVIEMWNDSDNTDEDKIYLFVGFNVLNQCEKMLFKRLYSGKRAKFYWDCDEYYIRKKNEVEAHEAGLFMRDNVNDFPNELDTFDLLGSCSRKIEIIGSASEVAQARYVSKFLKEREAEGSSNDDTVVVLCNENLLLPVLHSIPGGGKTGDECNVNVTMGLPIVQTPIYGLIQVLLDYQEHLHFLNAGESSSLLSTTLLPLLRNYYLRLAYPSIIEIEEQIQKKHWKFFKTESLVSNESYGSLFMQCESSRDLLLWLLEIVRKVSALFRVDEEEEGTETHVDEDEYIKSLSGDLYKESLYRIYTMLTRLIALLDEDTLTLEFSMMLQLINTLMSSLSVPFTGEMVTGTQIMGFLETRNLDFTNVILLSANEGTLPSSGKENSFVPYALRKGYGMTTIEHKNSLYAYYFYRLLQRAETVTLMYNTSEKSSSKGQMSRFLLQLMVEATNNTIVKSQINSDVPKNESLLFKIEKTDAILQKMHQLYDLSYHSDAPKKSLSASSLNMYLNCTMRFYLSKILRLCKQEEISDDVQVNEFGTVFHASMQYYYDDLMRKKNSRIISASDYPAFMIKERTEEEESITRTTDYKEFKVKIDSYVNKAFKIHYFNMSENESMPQLSGEQLMNRDAIARYVIGMLMLDAQYTPFEIIGNEYHFSSAFSVPKENGESLVVRFEGDIDRVDKKGETIRVLDYKTGGKAKNMKTIDSLFIPSKDRYSYALQVMMYSYFYSLEKNVQVKPAIAYLKTAKSLDALDIMLDKEVLTSANAYFAELKQGMERTIGELFDKEIPFVANKDCPSCEYCDYLSICGVKPKKNW